MVSRTAGTLASVVCLLVAQADRAEAQRFGGQFGAAGGFWLQYLVADVGDDRNFGRDLGDLVLVGGRGFIQSGRVRLGGGGFGGAFVDEGVNEAGNEVTGGFSGGGLIIEYLIRQQDLELLVGGLIGGGTLNIEERISVTGNVETVNRVRDTLFIGQPWVRVGYNLAPFLNTGVQIGYLIGTQGFDGFSLGIDITAGLIP